MTYYWEILSDNQYAFYVSSLLCWFYITSFRMSYYFLALYSQTKIYSDTFLNISHIITVYSLKFRKW